MLYIGLTGNIASGKSTVAKHLRELGAYVTDADALAREAVVVGSPGLKKITDRFGTDILANDGSLDRAALRKVVFSDNKARADLEGIVHPEVARLRAEYRRNAELRGEQVIVDEIPLLFETGLETEFDAVIFVDTSEDRRLHRLMYVRGLPESEARAMMSSQADAEEKRKRSTWVIDNNGSPEHLRFSVEAVWKSILALKASNLLPDGAPAVSNIPADLRYTKEHEYVRTTDEPGVVLVGITDFAQGELGDIVYVDLPKAGARFAANEVFGTVEAVKAVSELFSPVSGEVIEINGELDGEPGLVNSDPYNGGWMIKVKLDEGGDSDLLSADEYKALVG